MEGVLPPDLVEKRVSILRKLPSWSQLVFWPKDVINMCSTLPGELGTQARQVLQMPCVRWNWVCLCDLARMVALYVCGGLYLDFDVTVVGTAVQFEKLRASSFIATVGGAENVATDILGCCARDARMLQVIHRQVANLLSVKSIPLYPCSHVSKLTGPAMMSELVPSLHIRPEPLASRFQKVASSGKCNALVTKIAVLKQKTQTPKHTEN